MSDGNASTPPFDGPADVRVYVNERGVSVAHGSTALDAVRVHSPEHARSVAEGTSRLTDGRGLPIDAGHVVSGGLILRVLPVRGAIVPPAGGEPA